MHTDNGSDALTLQSRTSVARVYSLLAVAALGVFGFLHVLNNQATLGYLELAGSSLILANALLIRASHVQVSVAVYLCIVLAYLALMITTGGTEQTGIFWLFVFPVAAFFLTGKRAGAWWMAAMTAVIVGVWMLAAGKVITIPYSFVTLRQLLLALLVAGGGIYSYQRSREQLLSQTSESRKELRIEQLRADVIVRNLGEGIVVTDARGNVVSMSRTAEMLLGWTLDELASQSFIDHVPMLDDAGNIVQTEDRPLVQALRTGQTSTTTAVYRRKNGGKVPISVTSTPIIVEDAIIGVASTFHDISEERDVLRAKSEFTTLASHQLRTPLSAVSWMSELLLSGDAGQLTDEQRRYVQDIYHSNQRMSALVSEMLMVSSLELGALPVTPQKVDVRELAHSVVQEQLQLHGDKNLHFSEQYQDGLPECSYDPDITRLLLRTLLSNAAKYTPDGGNISLAITVPESPKDRWLRIEVQDNGYGIPDTDASKIFGKFFRATNIISKDTDGTGLGLYIVKTLLEYVGGRISFTSQENKGTTFTVLLPLAGMTPRQPNRRAEVEWEGVGNV